MRSTASPLAALVAGATLLLVASCTSSTADGPTTTAVVSVTVSPSVVDPSTPTSSSEVSSSPSNVDPSTAVSVSSDISPQEAADRAAIEAQWLKFWDIYIGLPDVPRDERVSTLGPVAVSPFKERLAESVTADSDSGIGNYGTVRHNIYWQFPVDGKSEAVVADCQDQSGSGTINITSGSTLSTGESRIDIRGLFVRDDSGGWKVQDVVTLGSSAC